MDKKLFSLANKLWQFNLLNHELQKSDCILVLGSADIRVAERAVQLYKENWAPFIIFSGGFGRRTKLIFQKPEAEIFADIAINAGIPKDKIIIENTSSNTGENISFTKKILAENNLEFNKFLLVQKPYMERRAYATFKKQWPEKNAFVTSPQLSLKEYINENFDKEYVINALVGDTQRIKEYSKNGFYRTARNSRRYTKGF